MMGGGRVGSYCPTEFRCRFLIRIGSRCREVRRGMGQGEDKIWVKDLHLHDGFNDPPHTGFHASKAGDHLLLTRRAC